MMSWHDPDSDNEEQKDEIPAVPKREKQKSGSSDEERPKSEGPKEEGPKSWSEFVPPSVFDLAETVKEKLAVDPTEIYHQMTEKISSASTSALEHLRSFVPIPPSAPSGESELLTTVFNQMNTGLSVGYKEGYGLFNVRRADEKIELERVHVTDTPHEIYEIARLYGTRNHMYVSGSDARTLHCCGVNQETVSYESSTHKMRSPILAVRINEKVCVVCTDGQLEICDVQNMKKKYTMQKVGTWRSGVVVDLSARGPCSLLAYPDCTTVGVVRLFDADALKFVSGIHAHESRLCALKFDAKAEKLATAAEGSHLVRVFQVGTKQPLFELTVGVYTDVTSFSFNSNSTLLAAATAAGPHVHVFDLEEKPGEEENVAPPQPAGYLNALAPFVAQAASLLPAAYQPASRPPPRAAFRIVRPQVGGAKIAVGLAKLGGVEHVLVASMSGFLYCYDVNPAGDECFLLRQLDIRRAGEEEEEHEDVDLEIYTPPPHGHDLPPLG